VLQDIVAANEVRDVFGIALTNMLADGAPATELTKSTETFKPILERTEKGWPESENGAGGLTPADRSRRPHMPTASWPDVTEKESPRRVRCRSASLERRPARR
jgi:hypothetical protein